MNKHLLSFIAAILVGGCASFDAHPERLEVDGYVYAEAHLSTEEFRPVSDYNQIRTCPRCYQWTMVKCVAVTEKTKEVVWRCSNCSRYFYDITGDGQ